MARWYLLLVAVCTGWGTIPLILREVDVAPSTIAFGRVLVAAVGLGAILAAQPGADRYPRPFAVQPVFCLVSAGLLAAHWLTMFIAFDRAPAGTVILIIFLAPVGVALVAPRLLGDHLSVALVAAVLLGLIGVGLIAGPALNDADPTGLAMAGLSMMLLVALNLTAKPLAGVYGGMRLAFMETAGAAVLLSPVAVALHSGSLSSAWPWIVLLGLAHTAAGVSLYLSALEHLPVTHVSILGYLEPASVVVLAWLVLAERPTLATSIGGLLVVGAGTLVITAGRQTSVPPEPVVHREVANVAR